MMRLVGGVVIGLVGGWMIREAFVKKQTPVSTGGIEQGPPAYRIAGEIIDIFDTLRPTLVDFRDAYEDGSLSTAELYRLYTQINALT